MLRGVVLKNFVQFKNRFIFDFSKTKQGPIIFVGASSTGKTAVLELIRRCMDRKLNSSLTNRYDDSEIAYVFCEFRIERGKYGPMVISGMIVEKKQVSDSYMEENKEHKGQQASNERECSTYIEGNNKDKAEQTVEGGFGEEVKNKELIDNTEGDKEEEELIKVVKVDKEDTTFHKVVMYFCKEKIKLCSETYLLKSDGRIVDMKMNVKLDQDLLDGIMTNGGQKPLTKSKDGEINENYFISNENEKKSFYDEFAECVASQIRKKQNENEIYNQYRKVWKELEENFVGVLSMRGMGRFQWTKSIYIDEKFKSDNYKDTCSQAEIINVLLESTTINKCKEQQIFNFLTSPNTFHFEKKLGTNSIFVSSGRGNFPLLKTSVGIVEAKQFSLLMAEEKFQTICLEEPDRGMHPQMIERMKIQLYRESRSKTIIVVSHSPYLIDSMSLENTFIFFKREGEACVRNVSDLRNANETLKIVETGDLKQILFSSKVLLVEGKSDKIALQAIFRHFFQSSIKYDKIMSYQIICMGGKHFRKALSNFCTQINLKYRIVLDRDAYIEVDKEEKITKIRSGSEDYINRPIKEFLEDPKGFKPYACNLASKKRTFIWKDGDLEDFLLRYNKRETVQEICNVLKVQYKPQISQLKEDLKTSLNNGLNQDQAECFAKIIKDFTDISRLLSFLED